MCSAVHPWRFSVRACLVVAFVLVAGNSDASNECNGFGQGQSICQIITDHFFDGNPSNNNADGNYSPSNGGQIHGGEFQGIEQKLGYIKALGATAMFGIVKFCWV